MYGGIFGNRFITNFLQNMSVKKFGKSVIIWQKYRQGLQLTFWPTLYG